MRRENEGEGYKVMKRGHEEKDMSHTRDSNLKYSKYGMDNEKELKEDVNDLSAYVKKNRMKY